MRSINSAPIRVSTDEVEARAAAVLRTVRLARQIAPRGGMIGLDPEGRDVPGGLGEMPAGNLPAGVGTLIELLVRAGLPVLPVGVGERAGRLCVSFGPLFETESPTDGKRRDRAVAEQVAGTIVKQLRALREVR